MTHLNCITETEGKMQPTDNNHRESDAIQPFIKLRNGESEDIHYSLFYGSIPKEFKDVVLKDLNETEENKVRCLLKLGEFLKGERIYGVKEHILLNVLRNCKYDIKKSENKLLKYLQTLDMLTTWLQTANIAKLETVLKRKVVGLLPYRDKHGRVIIYTNACGINLELFDMDDAVFCTFCLVAYALSFPLSTVAGFAYIAECKTQTLSVFYPIVKAFRDNFSSAFTNPVRIAKVDVINENFIARWGYKLMKPFMPSKLTQRITFHGSNIQGLQNFYHPAILPVEYGGTLGPMNPEVYIEEFFNFVEKLKSKKLYLSNA